MSAVWDVQKNGKKSVFYEHPMKRGYYYPSTSHKLNLDTKQIKLCSTHENMIADGKEFLNMCHVYQYQHDSGSPSFDESWPCSEKPTVVMEEVAQIGQEFDEISHNSSLKSECETQCDSVLAKCIERFHRAVPQSREHRQRQLDTQEFWWLSEKHKTFYTSKLEDQINSHPKPTTKVDTNDQVSEMTLSTEKHCFDDKTSHLLRKTDQLLEIASSLSSREHTVSTIGNGSHSSVGSVASEESFQPQFTKVIDAHLMNFGPDDDILEQWRRRRYLEVAEKNISFIQKDASTQVSSEQSQSQWQPQQEQQVACDATKGHFTCHCGPILPSCTHNTPFGCHFHLPCETLSPADCHSAAALKPLSSDQMKESVQPTDTYSFQLSLHSKQRTRQCIQPLADTSHVSISLPEVNHVTAKYEVAAESTMTKSRGRGHQNHSTFSAACVNTPVEQTVEQVVIKDRLFDVSDSFTVVSSVDSEPLDSYPTTCQDKEKMSDTSTDAEAILVSDGEEFADDQILEDLRHRRTAYLQVLLKLDCGIRQCSQPT